MTFDLVLFGSKLKRYREQFETSVDEVSRATGIPTQALASLERGERRPTGDRDGKFNSYHLDIEDLQEVALLQKRKNLGNGELASIAFAKKTNQAFLTDDKKARTLAEEIMVRQFVQTTPHLLGWLFFTNFLSDSDLKPIIDENKKHNRPLAEYFTEMYRRALDYRSKLYVTGV